MSEEKENVEQITEKPLGFVRESLNRNMKQIRADRAESIYEELELVYKRNVEDLENDIKKLRRAQLSAFDFGPSSTHSLVVDKIEAMGVMEEDVNISIKIREIKIKLNIARERYNFLFDQTYKLETIV